MIQQILSKHGFNLQDTGGGCTAYVRVTGELEEVITLDSDPSIPTRLKDVCLVQNFMGPGSPEESVSGYMLADIITALENPSTDHVLLTARLFRLIGPL